jgi:hypothetical protein
MQKIKKQKQEGDKILRMDQQSRKKIETFRNKHKQKMKISFKGNFVEVPSSRYGYLDQGSGEESVEEEPRTRRHKCCY